MKVEKYLSDGSRSTGYMQISFAHLITDIYIYINYLHITNTDTTFRPHILNHLHLSSCILRVNSRQLLVHDCQSCISFEGTTFTSHSVIVLCIHFKLPLNNSVPFQLPKSTRKKLKVCFLSLLRI